MTRFYSIAITLAAVALVLLGVEQYGEHRVRTAWNLERARQETIAQQAAATDKAAALATEAQRKKDLQNAKSEAGRRAVAAFLKSHGLLPDGSPVSGTGSGQANNPGKPDGCAGQLGSGDAITQFAERCALDALHVMRWQEWVIREGLDVR